MRLAMLIAGVNAKTGLATFANDHDRIAAHETGVAFARREADDEDRMVNIVAFVGATLIASFVMYYRQARNNVLFAAALGLCALATGIPAQAQHPRRLVQAAQAYDLPPGSVVIEERPVKSAAHSNRALLLWMINPERNPREAGEVYTCPEYTRGNYYSGATRVSLVNTRTRRVINTLKIMTEGDSDNDSFAIPYLIDRRFLYRVPAPRNGSEGKPVVMWLQDYNGDGRAQEFALFDALACMPILTTLIGYSEAQDRVIQYSAEIEVISGTERTTEKMYWVDYLFSMEPVRPGYWKYEIDYRGRGGALAKHEVRYNARRERFEGTFVLEPDPAE